jgi:tungstate transport system ATP-binding protein
MTTGTILPLELDNLAFEAVGKRLIDGISLTLGGGPRTIILGPNGAGKSLLLRLCHGLLQPTAGAIRWRGPAAVGNGRRQAMVFQHPVMLRRSAAANIDYALKLKGIPRTLRRARVREVLDDTGLSGLAQRQARTLSIGEQQRLALARAWAAAPEVMFLDEPTANLDPAATRAIEEVIAAIDLTGTKIIMTTHDLGQARRLADEIVFLHRGRLLEQRPAADFFAKPRTPEATAFIEGRLLW